MAKRRAPAYRHPLDQFLFRARDATNVEVLDQLELLAHQIEAAEPPFSPDSYRSKLAAALKRLRYPQPDPEPKAKTFDEVLKQADVLERLLSEDTLRELRKSELVAKILWKNDELEAKGLWVDEVPLRERRQKVNAIRRDLATLERLADKHGLQDMAQSYEHLAAQIVQEMIPILPSRRYTFPRERLLTGRAPAPQQRAGNGKARRRPSERIRSLDTAIQAIVYWTLKARLQGDRTGRSRLPDILLCQLAELIWFELMALPLENRRQVKTLSSGETLRRFAKAWLPE